MVACPPGRPRLQLGYSFWNPRQFALVRWSSLQFASRQSQRPRRLPHSGSTERTPAHCAAIAGHGNSQLAKVGVVGSNPIARSSFPNIAKVAESRRFWTDLRPRNEA